MKSAVSLLFYCWVFCKVAQMLSGMAALEWRTWRHGLDEWHGGHHGRLTQAYSGIQQHAAAALPTLAQPEPATAAEAPPVARRKVGAQPWPVSAARPRSRVPREVISRCPKKSVTSASPAHGLRHLTGLNTLLQSSSCLFIYHPTLWSDGPDTLCVPYCSYLVAVAAAKPLPGAPLPNQEGPSRFLPLHVESLLEEGQVNAASCGLTWLLQGPHPP